MKKSQSRFPFEQLFRGFESILAVCDDPQEKIAPVQRRFQLKRLFQKAEKAVSNLDIPNNFVVSYIYELPVGHGKPLLHSTPAPVNAIIGG